MIDQLYQSEIDKNLDQAQASPGPAPKLPLFQNFLGGSGGFVAGPLQAGASWSDILKGSGETLAATGAYSKGGMFATPDAEEQKQNDAAAAKIALRGPDTNSELGSQLRTQAKTFMPDPQSTGQAGVILGGLTTFASQAVPAGFAGPPGLVALGAQRGMQKAADLEEQGVSPAARTAAGVVSGTLDAASMLLPMTGPTRVIAAGKGAVGGAGLSVVQTEAEKLILQKAGYDKLASTYDPFDPVSIALSSLVPAVFGGLHAPEAAKAPGTAKSEPVKGDVALSPEEAANSQRSEDASISSNIAEINAELAKQKNPEAIQALTEERDRLIRRQATLADPTSEDAARVVQTAAAIDHSRLTPDGDLVGHEQHTQGVQAASDQIARGDPVEVGDVIGDPAANFRRWFGDSIIKDEAGNPVVMYHGTAADVDSFVGKQAHSIFVADHPIVGEAYAQQSAKWMADNGQQGAPNISPVFVRAEHPFDYDNPAHVDSVVAKVMDGAPEVQIGEKTAANPPMTADQLRFALTEGDWRVIEHPQVQAAIKALGHDSFFVQETGFKNLGLHNPNQLKSAIGNSGRFDLASGSLTDPLPNFARAVDQLREARAQGEPQAQPTKALETAQPKENVPRETAAKTAALSGSAEIPGPEATHLDAATEQVLRSYPDLMVQLDGMAEPMRAADLLESVRDSTKEEMRDASLLEVAAQCALS